MIAQKFGATGNLAVECHPFDLKELDNPAIAALVDYKWNTIGYRYWLVYGDHTETLLGLFIAVIAASAVFLFLEMVQYFNNPNRYFSPTFRTYNIADLPAFLSPMVGSIYQLLIILGHISGDKNLGFLSFSVLFISLHMLFELRVVKSVCHFVTIIIQVIKTIRVFFFVFTGGILGFTGGRYDPFNNDFKSDNWAFHLMLIVFFFFTVILMLNVLIALINLAFNNGDQTWRLTWLENRMRYVESAENMTYIFSIARPDGASKGGGGEDDNTSMQLYFEQKRAIDNLRSELKDGIKEELQDLRDENASLRAQVGDLQQQLSSLPSQIVALLRLSPLPFDPFRSFLCTRL
ncbi:hypothetical protein BGZ47_010432 [Haplosporangium gracile]|nr:hypothetical protein BGZ47_010432 [Haplosporangium gracile]